MTKTNGAWLVAILFAGAAGVALAQQGGGSGRSGPPPECVDGKHVVRTMPAAPRALRTCHTAHDCIVVDADCCGHCSTPAPDQLRAVRQTASGAWRTRVCGGPTATCPACVHRTNDDATPACVHGLCEVTVHDAACAPPTGMGTGHS